MAKAESIDQVDADLERLYVLYLKPGIDSEYIDLVHALKGNFDRVLFLPSYRYYGPGKPKKPFLEWIMSGTEYDYIKKVLAPDTAEKLWLLLSNMTAKELHSVDFELHYRLRYPNDQFDFLEKAKARLVGKRPRGAYMGRKVALELARRAQFDELRHGSQNSLKRHREERQLSTHAARAEAFNRHRLKHPAPGPAARIEYLYQKLGEVYPGRFPRWDDENLQALPFIRELIRIPGSFDDPVRFERYKNVFAPALQYMYSHLDPTNQYLLFSAATEGNVFKVLTEGTHYSFSLPVMRAFARSTHDRALKFIAFLSRRIGLMDAKTIRETLEYNFGMQPWEKELMPPYMRLDALLMSPMPDAPPPTPSFKEAVDDILLDYALPLGKMSLTPGTVKTAHGPLS